MKLILASQSPYRRDLLNRLGVSFVAADHRLDEHIAGRGIADPVELSSKLARGKADSLAAEYPQAHILASDQLVEVDGDILGKPGTVDAAVEQLLRLQGREHYLRTAVALRHPDGHVQQSVDTHCMRMRPLSAQECRRYVERDVPLDCCGSYKIESLGITLFDSLAGSDFTAIVGLPLMSVAAMLRAAGWQLP